MLQSYDIFSNVVSVAYGKYTNEAKIETTKNQLVTQNSALCPMENRCRGHGKKEDSLGSFQIIFCLLNIHAGNVIRIYAVRLWQSPSGHRLQHQASSLFSIIKPIENAISSPNMVLAST